MRRVLTYFTFPGPSLLHTEKARRRRTGQQVRKTKSATDRHGPDLCGNVLGAPTPFRTWVSRYGPQCHTEGQSRESSNHPTRVSTTRYLSFRHPFVSRLTTSPPELPSRPTGGVPHPWFLLWRPKGGGNGQRLRGLEMAHTDTNLRYAPDREDIYRSNHSCPWYGTHSTTGVLLRSGPVFVVGGLPAVHDGTPSRVSGKSS